jgi:hypothetical protein
MQGGLDFGTLLKEIQMKAFLRYDNRYQGE